MADVFEEMLRGAIDSLDRGDRKRVAETKRMDDVLDRLDRAIKEYLTSLDPDALDDADHRRLAEILAFIHQHRACRRHRREEPDAARRQAHQAAASRSPKTSREEIRAMIERLIANVRAAAAVFMTEDARAARRLLGEKEVFRDFENRATEAHFGRVRRRPQRERRDRPAASRHPARPEARQRRTWPRPPIRCWKTAANCCRAACKQDG